MLFIMVETEKQQKIFGNSIDDNKSTVKTGI